MFVLGTTSVYSNIQQKITTMRIVMTLFVAALIFSATGCKKENNRQSGVCYCNFANGEKQEYDLSTLSRSQQIDTCNRHNKNAGYFGGVCELE